MTITRYQCRYEDAWHSEYGDYVLHTDHLAALAAIEWAAYERGVRAAAQVSSRYNVNRGSGSATARAVTTAILALLTQEGR